MNKPHITTTTTLLMKLHGILLAAVFPLVVSRQCAGAEPIAFPIKVAVGGRFFSDAKGTPVFWLGTTQWELFRAYSLEDARTILEKSRDHGFTFVQVKLLGQGDGSASNVAGHKPLLNDDAPRAGRTLC